MSDTDRAIRLLESGLFNWPGTPEQRLKRALENIRRFNKYLIAKNLSEADEVVFIGV